MRRAIQTAVALFLLSSTAFAVENIDRLAHLGKLWGTVRYLHPWVAYKDIDWDAALVAALPRVRAAKTSEEYKAAVQGMLGALGDPATRVADPLPPEDPAPPVPAHGARGALTHELEGGVLVIELANYVKTASPREARAAFAALPEEIGKASAVILDLRGARAGMESFYLQERAVAYLEETLKSM